MSWGYSAFSSMAWALGATFSRAKRRMVSRSKHCESSSLKLLIFNSRLLVCVGAYMGDQAVRAPLCPATTVLLSGFETPCA